MGREHLKDRDERIREDFLAGVEFVKIGGEAAGAIAKGVPWVALLLWSYRQFSRVIEAPSEGAARVEAIKQWTLTVTPFILTLSGLYQGLAGVFSGAISSALTNLVGAMTLKEIPRTDPHTVGQRRWKLDWLDALFLASWLPLVLMSVSGKDVEKNPTMIA